MRLEIRRLHNRLKATSIFVTHDQVEAMTLADVVVVMNGGRIEQAGAPIDVYRRPASKFVATFIGSPAMNLVGGRVIAPGLAECTGGGRLRYDATVFEAATGQSVDVGVRPEDIEISSAGAAEALTFRCEFVEELGATRLIHGQIGPDAALVMAVPSAMPLQAAGTLMVMAPAGAVHLFDRQTGASLRA
jgi:sn-glycerol 3-phosphate transport system ATP-binding protein